MSGVIFPKILLPQGWDERIDRETLAWILAHESGHIRRGDMLWCWAFQLVRIVHLVQSPRLDRRTRVPHRHGDGLRRMGAFE